VVRSAGWTLGPPGGDEFALKKVAAGIARKRTFLAGR
jgi:hypothetical protein